MHANSNAGVELHESLLGHLRASGRLDRSITGVRPLVEAYKTIDVPDAPSRTVVLGARGEPIAVLFVSTPVDATYVARNVAKAEKARRILGEDLGSVILEPLVDGEFRGLSFALWPWHRPMSSVRGLARLQKRLLSGRVLAWLRGATEATVREPDADRLATIYTESLTRMAHDDDLPVSVRNVSKDALDRLESGAWRPRVVLQHKHIGGGNILLPHGRDGRVRFPRGFIVIDWAGANFSGYPFSNLLAFARDFRVRPSMLRAELACHCHISSCAPRDVLPYVLAALGFYRAQLGNFPEAQFRILSRNVLQHALAAVHGFGTLSA